MPDPNGQDSWENVLNTAHGDMRLAATAHNPQAARAEITRLQKQLAAAHSSNKELKEQLQHMTLRINSLERSSFTGMS